MNPDDKITDKTRRELFASLDEFLGIKSTDTERRIAFARANGVKVHSFKNLTEGDGQKLLWAIENAGPEGWIA